MEMPETYIVNNDQGDFDSFHNVLVDVLVSQGFIGVILIVVMGILFGKYFIQEIFIYRKMECEIQFTFLVVIMLLISSMLFLRFLCQFTRNNIVLDEFRVFNVLA